MNPLTPYALALGLTLGVAAAPGSWAQAAIDINTATAEQLAAAIDGVGERRAAAIVADREANGPFHSVDDLARVRGIGPAILDGSRDRLTAGAGE